MKMMNNPKSILLTGLVLLLSVTVIFGQTIKRALFLGNSYTAYNNLPQLTAEIAQSAGDTLEFDSNTPGGTTFANHVVNATTLNKIQQGNWDYVMLQEQSQIPSFPLAQVEADCFPYAEELVGIILENNPCATPMFYMTWGREVGDAQNCPNWPPVCTYEGMDDLLYERYMMLGEMNNAEVSPIGAAWRYIRENYPDIALYASDGSHPSAAGSYLAAVCHYTCIFRKDPLFATFNYTIDDAQEEIIRQAVYDVVYNNLSNWYIGNYDPLAAVDVEETGPLTITFTNLSENADETTLFINGQTIDFIQTYTHTFANEGDYYITLLATSCGLSDIIEFNVSVTSTGILTQAKPQIRIMPNPASNTVRINVDLQDIGVYDISGKYIGTLLFNNRSADISQLTPGIYQLVSDEIKLSLVVEPR
jgi:hypothetical protein